MEAHYDEDKKKWIFPGEEATEEDDIPSAPPTDMSMMNKSASSAPNSTDGGASDTSNPLSALMTPPPSKARTAALSQSDPLAAMMAPPARTNLYGSNRGSTTKRAPVPRPKFAVFKPTG